MLLRLTQLGRNACGPILLQRIKKKRASEELNVAMMKLSTESVSTKLSHQPLLSYGQVVKVFVHILFEQDQGMCLSPSGTRRLEIAELKQEHANELLRRNSSPKKRGVDGVGRRRGPALRPNFTPLKSRARGGRSDKEDDGDGNKEKRQPPGNLELHRREKEIERAKQPCGLCEHFFPRSSMPSSITNGEIQRVREEFSRKNVRIESDPDFRSRAEVRPEGSTALSLIQRLRFTNEYGPSLDSSPSKQTLVLAAAAPALAPAPAAPIPAASATVPATVAAPKSATPPCSPMIVARIGLMESAKITKIQKGDKGFFQVSQIRKPCCAFCHDLLGRRYNVVGQWKADDPAPSISWLSFHGIKNHASTTNPTLSSPRRLPKLQAESSLVQEMEDIGIYEDVDASEDDTEEEEDDDEDKDKDEEDSGKNKSVSMSQMKLDLEILLAEQTLIKEEMEQIRVARIEVKLRRKKVNEERRRRAQAAAKIQAQTQLDFFG